MLMLPKDTRIQRQALVGLDAPPPTDTWKPFPHITAFRATTHILNYFGYKLEDEEHYLGDNGHTYICQMRIRHKDPDHPFNRQDVDGVTYDVLVRNSTNKKWAYTFFLGSSISWCSNGCIWGATLRVRMSHKVHGDPLATLSERISPVVQGLGPMVEDVNRKLVRWKKTEVGVPEIRVVQLCRFGILASSDIIPVLDYMECPRLMTQGHTPLSEAEAVDAYVPGSTFCLHSAVTARVRDKSERMSIGETSQRLVRMGLAFDTWYPTPSSPVVDHANE